MKKYVPIHIGFIMDGNRRWAKERNLPTIEGHRAGKDRIETLVEHAVKVGVKYLTFWAFSTENWKRSASEVGSLLQVFREGLHDPMQDRLREKGVRIHVIGDISAFPSDIVSKIAEQ